MFFACKDTILKMLFQGVSSAIFLKTRKMKSDKFPAEGDMVWVKKTTIS